VGKGAAETGPAIHLGEQAGDAKVGHHPVQPIGEGLGLFGRRRLKRRDLQFVAFDLHVVQPVGGRFSGDLGEAPLQQRAPLGEVLLGGCRRRDGEWSGLAQSGEQSGRDQLILDGAPLVAALDPDVAGAQPVAQREQGGSFPNSTLRTIGA
jgi:hypothetical protein